jgi:hypothetical protein
MVYHPFRHLGLKALSVGLAALLWFVVARDQIVERSLRVPLEYQSIPEALEIVGDPPGMVDVRVRGASSALGRLQAGDVVAVLNLQGTRPGSRIFHLLTGEVRVPFGIEVTQVTPPLFGTDGVRGKAGEFPLEPDNRRTTRRRARPGDAGSRGRPSAFVVGRDTRESGEWIERELARGPFRSPGARRSRPLGVIPTPAVAYVAPRDGVRRGPRDLGLAQSVRGQRHQGVLGPGEKFTEALERQVEAIVADLVGWWRSAARPVEDRRLVDAYIAHARSRCPSRSGSGHARLAVDCANGATTTVAPRLFRELGFDVHAGQRAGRPQHQPANAGRPTPRPVAKRCARRLPDGGRVRRRRRPRDLRRRLGRSSTATPCC